MVCSEPDYIHNGTKNSIRDEREAGSVHFITTQKLYQENNEVSWFCFQGRSREIKGVWGAARGQEEVG